MSIIFISQVGNRDIYWDKAQRGEATCLGSHQGFWQRHDPSRSSELWASALNYQPSSGLQHLALPFCSLFAPSETHSLMDSNLFLNITYGLQLQMKISALQSYFTYPVILIEYRAKWLIRSLQGTVCLILFWNVCLHKCHTRKSLEATIIYNVKIFRFLWSFPSPEGSNSSPLVDKSSSEHPPPALVPSRNMTLFLSRHADKWWIRLSPRKCCSSFPKAHCCLNNSAFPTVGCL